LDFNTILPKLSILGEFDVFDIALPTQPATALDIKSCDKILVTSYIIILILLLLKK
jgi:hypothetical protein